MAYLSPDLKKELSEKVKSVLPKNWKATFKNRDLMSLVITIKSAPIHLKDLCQHISSYEEGHSYVSFNHYCVDSIKNEDLRNTVKSIIKAALSNCNIERDDNYGSEHDYYLDLQFGSFNKGFISTIKE